MSAMFDNYPEVTEVDSSAQVLEQATQIEKDRKRFKKLKRRLKKQEKALKELQKLLVAQRPSANETSAVTKADANIKKPNAFLNKLGDAVIKAVPAILTTIVTAVLGFFFKGKTGSQSRKLGGVTV